MTGIKPATTSFRKDVVSGGWILVASGRRDRPFTPEAVEKRQVTGNVENCPFENPQKNDETAVLWYPQPGTTSPDSQNDWFVQVITNKYPVLFPHNICPEPITSGPYQTMEGTGFHEVVITKDHHRTIVEMETNEVDLILRAFVERMLVLKSEACIEYVLVFHNQGAKAGASIIHPHSQLIALPIVPPDVARSVDGSLRYFAAYHSCAHCTMLDFELKEKDRIVFENEDFAVICPYASHVSYETRIYPREHESRFELINSKKRVNLAAALKCVLRKTQSAMSYPDYNFFIHTAPVKSEKVSHYHWHIEILPRTNIWAGLELGTGIEVIAIAPEEAAEALRKVKV